MTIHMSKYIVAAVVTTVIGAFAVLAVLGALGCAAAGPATGSAAAWQASIGNVAAGSRSSGLQGAAMTGTASAAGAVGGGVAGGAAAGVARLLGAEMGRPSRRGAPAKKHGGRSVEGHRDSPWRRSNESYLLDFSHENGPQMLTAIAHFVTQGDAIVIYLHMYYDRHRTRRC